MCRKILHSLAAQVVWKLKLVWRWCLSALLGCGCYAIPYAISRMAGPYGIDPFDYSLSYVVWLGGAFLGAIALSRCMAMRKWTVGLAIPSGFLSAMVLGIVIDEHFFTRYEMNNLWPLSLAFGTIIVTPPALLGAYLGAKLRSRERR